MMDIREQLAAGTLLFDGAMGSYYAAQYPEDEGKCEMANVHHPARVLDIHCAYLDAGARAIKTNTFGANTQALECGWEEARTVIRAGWKLACEAAAGREAYVFADIGPLSEPTDEYRRIVDEFLDLGARHFLFETFSDDAALYPLAVHIKQRDPQAFILCSFAAAPDGFTRQGLEAHALLRRVAACPEIDAAGFNCVSGPRHMLGLIEGMEPLRTALSVMPNAGYPTVVRGRTVFGGSPAYFGARCAELAAAGARILGGCCGTTPDYIKQAAAALADAKPAARLSVQAVRPAAKPAARNRLAEKLDAGKRVIAVELDPPADSNITAFLDGARRLKAAGVDAVTIADCPVARVRVDSSLLAAKLRRELDLDPIPHMTCRDRNINATKALLLGLSVEDVHNVLVVTGDPIPSAERDEVKGVFSFNSVVLAGYIRELGEQGVTAPFRVAGALNVNAPHFEHELRKAVRKQEAGVSCFLTQPVFTEQAFANLALAHETLDAKILGGVIPIVSHRNALFMSHEMAGISIQDELVARYEGLDRAAAEALAVEVSVENARRMEPVTDGLYLITPFQRVSLIERILNALRA